MIDPHFIRRDGGWFRPGAEGYTRRVAEAGLFDGETARAYLANVEGISIHPIASVRTDLADDIARMREALAKAETVLALLPAS